MKRLNEDLTEKLQASELHTNALSTEYREKLTEKEVIHAACGQYFDLFRGEITPLSFSYNISGLVPVCWLLFQCF